VVLLVVGPRWGRDGSRDGSVVERVNVDLTHDIPVPAPGVGGVTSARRGVTSRSVVRCPIRSRPGGRLL